jgi:hypothetical protein
MHGALPRQYFVCVLAALVFSPAFGSLRDVSEAAGVPEMLEPTSGVAVPEAV